MVPFLLLSYLEQDVPKYDFSSWVEEYKIEKVLIVFAHQDGSLPITGEVLSPCMLREVPELESIIGFSEGSGRFCL